MSQDRFQVTDVPSISAALAGGVVVKVKDKVTGNEAEGVDTDRKKAEARAWENLKKKQGPPPSETGKKA